MQAVVDTNVWVSAFLTPGGPPAKLLEAMYSSRLVPVFSTEIELEYRAVLARSKFNIDRAVLADFLEQLHTLGQYVEAVPALKIELPDPTDAPFMALARHAGCPVITGNTRHFPVTAGVVVMSPVECEWVAWRNTR